MSQTIETATSVAYGATLTFEDITATVDDAPLRLREQHETLLRVVEGTVVLEVDGAVRALAIEQEARVPAAAPYRLWTTAGQARIVQELRGAA